MPINNDNVAYKYGTQSQFDALGTKDGSTFYVTTDSQRMYLGDTEIGHGELVITVTTNAEEETITADKSYAEVTAAVNRNIDIRVKLVVLDVEVMVMQYMGTVNGCHNFLGFRPSPSDDDSRLIDTRLKCYQESGNDVWRIVHQGK